MASKSPGGPAKFLSTLSGIFSLGGGGETSVGLSIGTSSVKLVELKRVAKGWKLLHFGIVQLPADVIINREIVNPIAVIDSIKTLMSQLKLKTRSVCISLSGTSMIIKRMTLEVPNIKELQDSVFWEAEQYLPFDASEVVMDYHLISRAKDNKTDVLLVAVKTTVLDSYIAAAEGAGLKPKVVDIDYFALFNAFELSYPMNPDEAVLIVDLGAAAMKAIVVHAGVPIYTKDTAIGGANLTAEIQKHLSLSYADAEMLKIGEQAGAMPQEVNDLIHIMGENFATEIKRSIDFYNASSSAAPVSYILLTGGSSKLPELSRVVEEAIGLPTQLMNPFNAISYDPAVFTQDYVNAIAPLAAIPIGLAVRAGSR